MNDEILKKLGYNNIALEMMLKREAQIDPNDIIMEYEIPGRSTKISKDPFTRKLDIITAKLIEVQDLINEIKSHPKEDRYDEDDKVFPMHKRYAIEYINDAKEEIKNISEIE